MCIGIWTLEHPDYALILCANRDEYLSRPTVDAHFHNFDEPPKSALNEDEGSRFVLSGRDLKAGGSWLGVNRSGRVALLTNITEETGPHRSSRGHLVSSFLMAGAPTWEQYATTIMAADSKCDYAGFNLLLFSPKMQKQTEETHIPSLSYDAALLTNSGAGGNITPALAHLRPPERQVCALSNGVDTAGGRDWPKAKRGRELLENLLFGAVREAHELKLPLSEDQLADRLFEILRWQPDIPPSNRFGLRTSINIPPIQITTTLDPTAQIQISQEAAALHDQYGTRLSTVVLVDRNGFVRFIERDVWLRDADGNVVRGDPRRDRDFRFRIDEATWR